MSRAVVVHNVSRKCLLFWSSQSYLIHVIIAFCLCQLSCFLGFFWSRTEGKHSEINTSEQNHQRKICQSKKVGSKSKYFKALILVMAALCTSLYSKKITFRVHRRACNLVVLLLHSR